jgi:pyridoxamine 5'-phosphate oxidase
VDGPTDIHSRPLSEGDVDPDPLRQFGRWLAEAEAAGIRASEAMALATATPDGRPSVRMVLLKGADEQGFSFYSGYASRKGRELEANPRAALLFYWDALGRQVRVEGTVERLPAEESDAYFATRPRGSRLAARASRQSEPLADRTELERAYADADRRHPGAEVPRPPGWGGFLLRPERYELWQHRDSRLHDRLAYEPAPDGSWVIRRLAP